MFVAIIDGSPVPYTIGELRRDNPNVSFPENIPLDMLAAYGVYKVKETPAPALDSKTHRHVLDVQLIDGEWTEVWQIVELPFDQAADNVRAYRGRLLQDSDWVVAKSYELGQPVPADWAAYRQALRNVPEQPGFPWAVQWPVAP